MRMYKRPCAVCGRSYMMKRDQTVCDDCRSRAGQPGLTFDAYAAKAAATNGYPEETMAYDLVMGLCSEAGEVAGKMKKIDRDRGRIMTDGARLELALEVSDCLWYCSQLALKLGFPFGAVAQMNLDKLAARAERGTVGGEGDHR
jgi:NTP pyrophosphatase (non-canonical NTP hydrolase)